MKDYTNLIYANQIRQLSKRSDLQEGIKLANGYKYRIGFSLAEKEYMLRGKRNQQGQNNQIKMSIVFKTADNTSKIHHIELGKTQLYECEVSNLYDNGESNPNITFNDFPHSLIVEITCLGKEEKETEEIQ